MTFAAAFLWRNAVSTCFALSFFLCSFACVGVRVRAHTYVCVRGRACMSYASLCVRACQCFVSSDHYQQPYREIELKQGRGKRRQRGTSWANVSIGQSGRHDWRNQEQQRLSTTTTVALISAAAEKKYIYLTRLSCVLVCL